MSKNRNGDKTASVLKQEKHLDGLFDCQLEHRIVDTKAQFKWLGPRIPAEEWEKVLAFFQWTHDETRSESQVRGYVNIKEGTWKFWAYPQEARTGMSAQELGDDPKFKEQRAQFNDDWLYFCTVHHHCNMKAFQSSVDEQNEIGVDGLHITVGDMDEKSYSLHERFYLGGQLIAHDLSWFWDIGAAVDDVPNWARKYLPGNINDMMARGQMTQKVDKNATFPDQWKENLIARKIVISQPVNNVPAHYQGGLGYQMSHGCDKHRPWNIEFDLRNARYQIIDDAPACGFNEEGVIALMKGLIEENPIIVKLTEALYANDVSLEKLYEFMKDWDKTNKVSPATAGEQEKIRKQFMGVPDRDGPNYNDEGAYWANQKLPQ